MIRLMIPVVFLFPILACSTFITKPEETLLKERENSIYVLKKDIEIENKKLKKGEEVKIAISTSRSWVKVYAYPLKTDKLKADRYLLVYLFEDEFPEKKFIIDLFNDRLGAAVDIKRDAGAYEKKTIKQKKK